LVSLKFRNLSKSPANHLNVTFYDSTTAVLEEALNSTLLAEDEAIELEVFLYERPAFVWLRDSADVAVISSDQTEDIRIQVSGKRGLTRGVVYLEYAFTDNTSPNINLHCRQIEFNLAVTVNTSLELISCDFMPISEGVLAKYGLHLTKNDERFLLILEMRNSWITPLTLALAVTEANKSPYIVSQLLQSGQTRRVIISLPRILLSAEKADKPLPRRKRDRQFVVSSAATKSSVVAAREAWWYRQYILESMSGRWKEQGDGGRQGNVELRGIRLSERHVRVVKREMVEARVKIALVDKSCEENIWRVIVEIQNHEGIRRTICCLSGRLPSDLLSASHRPPEGRYSRGIKDDLL
jgi:trafficking protein particle complex subunit 9